MSNLTIEHILKASAGGKFPRVWHPEHGIGKVVSLDTRFGKSALVNYSGFEFPAQPHKLILRPISSMTESEFETTHKIDEKPEGYTSYVVAWQTGALMTGMGFDIWGYLDAGLAITPEEAEKGGSQ